MRKPKATELLPVPWDKIEPHYRAGIRSLRHIGKEFGVSAAGILLHFRRRGVTRDLQVRIQAQAQAKVEAAALNEALRNGAVNKASEKKIVEANAALVSTVHLSHRNWSGTAIDLVTSMMSELKTTMDAPEVFCQVRDLLAASAEPPAEQLRELAELVSSLPAREKVLRGLLESLQRAIGLQRVAYGLDEKQKAPEERDSFESLRDLAEALAAR